MILSVTIPPAFEYVDAVVHWFWPTVGICSFLGLIWIVDTCRN